MKRADKESFVIGTEPHEMVSDAFINFMHQRSELSSFVEYYHRLAKAAIQPDGEHTKVELYGEYRGQSIFFLENYICRVSDFFEVYVDELVFSICLVKRDFLPAQSYNKACSRLERLQIGEFNDADVVYEAATNFGRKDRNDISEYFKEKLNFELSLTPSWQDMVLCSKIRNLIVHKGSTMDERFVAFAKDLNLPFEVSVGAPLLLEERWLLELARKVDSCIFIIDHEISNYVNVHKRSRFGHFWFNRSAYASKHQEET